MYKEQTNKKDIWNPHFYKLFSGFDDCASIWNPVEALFLDHWPKIEDYKFIANHCAHLQSEYKLDFIQDSELISYEDSVYQHNQIPTRLNSWHDFFNNLTWMRWPKSKRALIEKNYGARDIAKTRTEMQNTLAHFDECGVVIVSARENYFELLQEFNWKDFFQDKLLRKFVKPYLIGHGVLEKCLNPYIGLTAKGIFLKVPVSFFELSSEEQYLFVDAQVALYIRSNCFPEQPRCLQPFPLLGWPGWYYAQNEAFYNNALYFRPKRNVHQQSFALSEFEGKSP